MSGSIHSYQGFSLIELILIILLIAIVSVNVIPRDNIRQFSIHYEAQRILNDVRYAQQLSISTGQRYRWVRATSTSYQITNQSGTPATLPSGGVQHTLSSGLSFGTLVNLPSGLVAFDSLGTPYGTSALPGTPIASTATITLSGSGQTRTISITPQTGYAWSQ